jgi:hypothetical protein
MPVCSAGVDRDSWSQVVKAPGTVVACQERYTDEHLLKHIRILGIVEHQAGSPVDQQFVLVVEHATPPDPRLCSGNLSPLISSYFRRRIYCTPKKDKVFDWPAREPIHIEAVGDVRISHKLERVRGVFSE